MKVLVLLFFTIPVISLGQSICHDFENHDLTGWIPSEEGRWCVSDENTLEGSYSLKHCYDNDQAGTDRISLIHDPLAVEGGTWRFRVAYQFPPSAYNNWAVMITENCFPDEDGNLTSGLIVGVNYIGNSDEIKVWEVNGGVVSERLNTGINWQKSVQPGEPVGFELSAQDGGECMLRTDTTQGLWNMQGYFNCHALENPTIFSLWHKYTASYDQGLWLDDLCITGNFTKDTLPPAISSIYIMASGEVEVELFEPVTWGDETVWQIGGMRCSVQSSQLSGTIQLSTPDQLEAGEEYLLEYPLLSDIFGNELPPGAMVLYYPRPYDILISEIMADPEPAVGLPESEYLGIMNVSGRAVGIKGWTLLVNGRFCRLPVIQISEGEEIILLPESEADAFAAIFPIQEVASFPTLNNQGAELILCDASGTLIHAVQYKAEWHESGKREGGWSLEMMDLLEPCSGEENWSSSEDPRGGTPGEMNSVDQGYRGQTEPEFWRAAITDSGMLKIWFSEPMDSLSISNPEYYWVDHDMGHPAEIRPSWPLAENVELRFTRPFAVGIRYEISFTSDLCDCSRDNLSYPFSGYFQVSEEARPGDILINEILFDPEAGHIEFIELFNNSEYRIDLKDFRLVVGGMKDSIGAISFDHWPLDRGMHALIAEKLTGIDSRDRFSDPEKIIRMQNMPILPNNGAEIYLFTPGNEICDAAVYSPDYHHEILAGTKGISLERISINKPGFSPDNWHSASSDAGYMTPGAVNSQAGSETNCYIRVSPGTVTQNGNGMDDRLTIEYQLDKEGYMAQVFICSTGGENNYSIAQGILLGAHGKFEIEGSVLREAQLSTGYYILFFKAYHKDGSSFLEKVSFVLIR